MSSTTPATRLLTLALMFCGCILSGCAAPNRWQETFTQNPSLRDFQPPPTSETIVRTVEWDRLEAFDAESRQRLARTDIPIDEWTPDQHRREFADFLRTLRITEEPEQVLLLGSSSFISDGRPNLLDGELESFARKLGADYAVTTSRHLGARRTIIRVPVTTYSTRTSTFFDSDRRRRSGRATFDETISETTWVPREIDIDAHHTITYFFRKTTPEEFSRLNPTLWFAQ